MKRTTTRKASAAPPPDPLTWDEIDGLASALTQELMMAEVDTAPLMLLLADISEHPFDCSRIESIVNVMNMRLFARTTQATAAFCEMMRAEMLRLERGAR